MTEKREENERWEKPVAKARREEDVWEVVNRQRKRRKKMNEGIEMEVYKDHFVGMLGKMKNRIIREVER